MEPKLLAKTLANGLIPYIPDLTHLDQTGFMPGRAAQHIIRQISNATVLASCLEWLAAVLLADVDKVFNSVRWDYLFALLRRLNLVPRFFSYVWLLYNDLKAAVRIAGHISDSFPIQHRRHACGAISQLLFALVVKPFGHLGRSDCPGVRGWSISPSCDPKEKREIENTDKRIR
ncbi:hypothetical protein NDU88_006345 [Pleurodeles waltl]|uniref:Reverse transcriptase domain-containing protein n=1 Tax=Pleurodeles waltl TaxID=8319 RepID=A0AAV7MD11_PLEWA|nr:hypothetical protein NDU88_006345 [Pleurodeles waltl]